MFNGHHLRLCTRLFHKVKARKIAAGFSSMSIDMSSHTNSPSNLPLEVTSADIRGVIPALSCERHKGQRGRIGIIGGSDEYTGAPYLSGMTALRLGADLAHIFCERSAATAIKCYSPDLIVHPILDDEDSANQIAPWLDRLHAVVIGPGLGRRESTLSVVEDLIKRLVAADKPLVIDADGLFLVTAKPELVRGHRNVTLTPNKAEFSRLKSRLGLSESEAGDEVEEVREMSRALGGITIVRKGAEDVIANENAFGRVVNEGTLRRCGGQGDLLSGAIATFMNWTHSDGFREKRDVSGDVANVIGAYAGCNFMRTLSDRTYFLDDSGTSVYDSVLASDMVANIAKVLADTRKYYM